MLKQKRKEGNPKRPITKAGRHATADVAVMAAKLGLGVQQIRHSGKTRAKRTAQILAEALSPAGGVIAVEGMGPLDDVEPISQRKSNFLQRKPAPCQPTPANRDVCLCYNEGNEGGVSSQVVR